MLKLMPTPDEIELCSSFDGDVATLGNPEKFILAVNEVPHASIRIKALITKATGACKASGAPPNFHHDHQSSIGNMVSNILSRPETGDI